MLTQLGPQCLLWDSDHVRYACRDQDLNRDSRKEMIVFSASGSEDIQKVKE